MGAQEDGGKRGVGEIERSAERKVCGGAGDHDCPGHQAGKALHGAGGKRRERRQVQLPELQIQIDGIAFRRRPISAPRRDLIAVSGHLQVDGDYRRALGLKETSAAQAGLGRALYDGNQPLAAQEALLRAIELDARNARAWLALGEIYLEQDRKDEARQAYLKYLEIEPNGPYARDVRSVLQQLP